MWVHDTHQTFSLSPHWLVIWQTKDWNTPGRASLWSRHEGLPNLKVQHLHSIDYSEYRYRLAPAGRRAQMLAVSWTLVRHKEEEAYWWAWNRKPICPKLCTDTKQKLSTAGGGTGNPPILDPAQVCSKVLLSLQRNRKLTHAGDPA